MPSPIALEFLKRPPSKMVRAKVTNLGSGLYKKVALNSRVRRDIREGMEGLVRLWQHVAKLKGEDADVVDLTYVLERLLGAQLNAEWGHWGLKRAPQSKEQWDRLFVDVATKVKAEIETK